MSIFSLKSSAGFNYKLFALIVIAKLVFLVIAQGFSFFADYKLSMFSGDSFDYLRFATQFVETGEYKLPGKIDGVTEYVYRMPGMTVVLGPLLYLFSFSTAIKLFVIVQILVASYAACLLYSVLSSKVNLKWINYILLFYVVFGFYFNKYTSFILSETLAQSLFIIVACYFISAKRDVVNFGFVLVSLAFAWMFFLRPFMIVFFPLICLKLVDFKLLRTGIVAFFRGNKPLITFAAVVLGIMSLWTLRNYVKTNEPVLMEYSVKPEKVKFMKECIPPLYDYIRHFGGNQYATAFDEKTSHLIWFYPERSLNKNNLKRPADKIFPDVVFSDGITIDSLANIRTLIDSTLSQKKGSNERKQYFDRYMSALERADKAVLNNTGWMFHLKNRKDAFLRFIIQPIGKSRLFEKISAVQPVMMILNKVLNMFFITVMIGLALVFGFYKWKEFYFLLLPAVFLLYFFIGYYNIKEERELYCFYPVFLIIGFEAIDFIINKIKTKRKAS